MPAVGVDGVGVGGDAEDGCAVDVDGLSEVDGVLALEGAPLVEGGDGDEGGDGPGASAEWGFARADFAVDEAEESRGDERNEEGSENEGFEDEDDGAGVPVGIEGEEGTEAVVVGPVEEEMAE